MRERHVGFVFQHYALFRHMTVFENVAFGLRVKPRGRAADRERDPRRRSTSCSSWCSSAGWPTAIPSQLSGGQRQRVALARALAVEPRVLLLDEPFGALDAKVRKELRRWLRRLHDELHITSIFVTHDQEEALEVADRVVLMNKGRVEQIGTPTRSTTSRRRRSSIGFLGAVNGFRGRVEGSHMRIGNLLLPTTGALSRRQRGRRIRSPARDRHRRRRSWHSGIPAKVARVHPMGAMARVELTGQTGSNGATETQHFEVEVSRGRVAELHLAAGQPVRLVSRQAHVFAQ